MRLLLVEPVIISAILRDNGFALANSEAGDHVMNTWLRIGLPRFFLFISTGFECIRQLEICGNNSQM